jgi:hypothetical protein
VAKFKNGWRRGTGDLRRTRVAADDVQVAPGNERKGHKKHEKTQKKNTNRRKGREPRKVQAGLGKERKNLFAK